MFVATIRTEYRFVPVSPVLRFTGVSDLDEYRESLQNPSCTVVHYVQPAGELDGASAEAPELVDLTVDGVPRPIRRMARTRAQVYAASIGDVAMRGDRSVAIAYTHRLLVQQHGHLLHLDISRPTKRLRVQFAYGGSGIRYVSVLDYIAGSTQARLSRLPASEPTPNIALGFDGWVLPKAGERDAPCGPGDATGEGVRQDLAFPPPRCPSSSAVVSSPPGSRPRALASQPRRNERHPPGLGGPSGITPKPGYLGGTVWKVPPNAVIPAPFATAGVPGNLASRTNRYSGCPWKVT
jgi:hypothetical protein